MSEWPPPEPTVPNLSIEDNYLFLNELGKLLDNIVFYWDQVLFEREFRPQLRNAWTELRRRFRELIVQLLPDRIDDAIEDRLQNAGLGESQEAQRNLKLSALSAVWTRFFERPTVRKLKELLGWIDQLLDSLVQVIPGLEAVKEFKETIERLIVSDES